MSSDLDRAIARNRAALRSVDRAAMAELLAAYRDALARLDPLIESVEQMSRARGITTPLDLFRTQRYQELQRQIATELERLARITGDVTTEAQARAVRIALNGSEDMAAATARGRAATATVTAGWVNVPTGAVEDLVGLANTGPLRDLLQTFGDDGMRVITDELTRGMALGQGPRTVADAITDGLDISRNRALTISRTEMLRANRLAAGESYRANADILNGWYWTAAHSARTCAACLAMDGTLHGLDEEMDSHPNCRCAKRPALKNIPEAPYPTGADWLATQPVATQDAILGKAGGAAYRNGEVRLDDFVRRTDSPTWGPSVTDGGLNHARLQASARQRVTAMPKRPRTTADRIAAIEGMGVNVSGVTKHAQMNDASRIVSDAFDNLRAMNAPLPKSIRFYANPKSSAPAIFTSADETVHINLSAKWNNMSATAANQKKHGFWSSGDELHAIYHETGHAAHYRTLDAQGQAYRFDNRNWFGPKPSNELVSRYAATNPLEFVAEVYAGRASGVEYSDDVMRVYRQYGGPELPKPKRERAAS